MRWGLLVPLSMSFWECEVADKKGTQVLKIYGRPSQKMIGKMVSDALLEDPVIIVDGTEVRAIAGKPVLWVNEQKNETKI